MKFFEICAEVHSCRSSFTRPWILDPVYNLLSICIRENIHFTHLSAKHMMNYGGLYFTVSILLTESVLTNYISTLAILVRTI